MPRSRSTNIRTPSATACGASWPAGRRSLTVARAGALHPLDGSLAQLLGAGRERLHDAVDRALQGAALTEPATLLAPVDEQEVWASGVTYRRSATARVEESSVGNVDELVDQAERPELFLKAPATRGPRRVRRCASGPTRPRPSRARAGAGASTPTRRSSATWRPTTSPRARSRAQPALSPAGRRSTMTRSGLSGTIAWPATACNPRSAVIELEIRLRLRARSSPATLGQRDESQLRGARPRALRRAVVPGRRGAAHRHRRRPARRGHLAGTATGCGSPWKASACSSTTFTGSSG